MARTTQVDISEQQYKDALLILEEGGTKKSACEALGIAYNTKRLDNLLIAYGEGVARDKALRAKKRRTAVDKQEAKEIIVDYLNGYNLGDLSSRYYRSVEVIKYHLSKYGALLRINGAIDPLHPPLLPEECIAESFEIGQYVWAAKYGQIAQVVGKYKDAYRIQVFGDGIQEFSYQPYWELGDLSLIEALGVDLSKFSDYLNGEEVKAAILKARIALNKRMKKSDR